MGCDTDFCSRKDIKTQFEEKVCKGIDLNEKQSPKTGEISKGAHIVYLIKGNHFIDQRNVAYLIYLDFSKENDIALPWKLV